MTIADCGRHAVHQYLRRRTRCAAGVVSGRVPSAGGDWQKVEECAVSSSLNRSARVMACGTSSETPPTFPRSICV